METACRWTILTELHAAHQLLHTFIWTVKIFVSTVPYLLKRRQVLTLWIIRINPPHLGLCMIVSKTFLKKCCLWIFLKCIFPKKKKLSINLFRQIKNSFELISLLLCVTELWLPRRKLCYLAFIKSSWLCVMWMLKTRWPWTFFLQTIVCKLYTSICRLRVDG